jgi:hypothetical protein
MVDGRPKNVWADNDMDCAILLNDLCEEYGEDFLNTGLNVN